MRWQKFVLPAVLAGTTFSLAFAQDSSAAPVRSGPAARSSQAAPGGRTPIGQGAPAMSTIPGTRPSNRNSTGNSTVRRQEPCWQVAGISRAALQQRQALARQTRQEVESVCADSSLSIVQKRERIRAIRQQERQQIESLITPQQQAAMRACQQERNGGAHLGGGRMGGGHGSGPCGTMPGFENHESENESTTKD